MNKEELIKLRNSVKELDKEIEIKLKNDLAKNKEFVNSRRHKLLNKKSRAENHFKNLYVIA